MTDHEYDEVESRTRAAYDEWAATYDTSPNPQTLLEYEDVMALLAPRPGERILDAACGTGRYTAAIAERGATVIGVDFSERMLAEARRRLPNIELRLGDLTKPLGLPASSFDAVVCGQALKHLSSLDQPFAEFARLLRPSGRLVFSVTHPDMNWTDYEMSRDPGFIVAAHADIYHHTIEQYLQAIAGAGFLVECTAAIAVSERVRHLLTARSFAIVAGRPQILAMRVRKRSDSV
ncbi:MAG TPA: class I SAM-dependent methyltransferase [Gemmatimonadaceae bacterium]|nr:class I SAM-dependent methyltransferase [Gemmatimonadaceae bacterium]